MQVHEFSSCRGGSLGRILGNLGTQFIKCFPLSNIDIFWYKLIKSEGGRTYLSDQGQRGLEI
jgi:hypothetical protein